MEERREHEAAGGQAADGTRWAGRPVLARAVRLATFAVPVLAAVLAGMAVSRALPPGSGLGWAVARFAAVGAVSTVVLAVLDRLFRRFLPLAALLKLSLAFPDKAPSRFSVALRAGSTAKLERHAARVRARGPGDDPSEAAGAVLALVTALNAHDRRTRGHSERVRAFTDLVAEEMGLSPADRERLRWAGLLHDVGKLHVKTSILNKAGKPTDQEWEALRAHPVEGARLIAPLAGWLGPWAGTVEHHHERWDGSGYPHGLAGEHISLGARIVAVADAFEVMTAARAYQRPVKADAARRELARCAGEHFDPGVVRAFLNISIGRLRATIGPLSLLAQVPFLGRLPQWQGTASAISHQAAAAVGSTAAVGAVAASSWMMPVSADHAASTGAGPAQTGATAPMGTEAGRAAKADASATTPGPATAPPPPAPPQAAPAPPAPRTAPSGASSRRTGDSDAPSRPEKPSPAPAPRPSAQPVPAPTADADDSDADDSDDDDRSKNRNRKKKHGGAGRADD